MAAVTVVVEAEKGSDTGPLETGPGSPKGRPRRPVVPTKYTDPKTSGLSVDVKAGAQEFRIDLK
jgi:hypothetical protein